MDDSVWHGLRIYSKYMKQLIAAHRHPELWDLDFHERQDEKDTSQPQTWLMGQCGFSNAESPRDDAEN